MIDLTDFRELVLDEGRPKAWSFAVIVQYNKDNDRGEDTKPRIANVHRTEPAAEKEIRRLSTSKALNAQRKLWVLPRAEAEKLGEQKEPTLRQVTETARRLVEAPAWDARRSAMTSAGASLTPKAIEDIFAELTGLNLKATLKTARQLGRDFFRQWKERSEPGPISDALYRQLMRPYDDAYKKLKSPDDDLSHAAVRQFVAVNKAEGKISGAWRAGFTETKKLRDAAEQKRKLDIIHAAPPDVFHKHDKNNGYGGVAGVERVMATTTDPAVLARLQKMLDLMKAPLDY